MRFRGPSRECASRKTRRRRGLCVLLGVIQVATGIGLAASPAGNKLPVFADGEWKGKHAVYEHANYRATMDANGTLSVRCLDGGKDAGASLTCWQLRCYYHTPHKVHEQYRPVIRFDKPPKPAVKPSEIVLQGLLQDNVPFKVEYKFSGNKITVAGGCADPAGIEFPTRFRLQSNIGSSWNIHPFVPQTERIEMLKDCVLTIKARDGNRLKTTKHPYYECMRFMSDMEEAEISGPYGRRKVTLDRAGAPGSLHGWIHWGNCPWQGYSIFYSTQGQKIDLANSKVVMEIR